MRENSGIPAALNGNWSRGPGMDEGAIWEKAIGMAGGHGLPYCPGADDELLLEDMRLALREEGCLAGRRWGWRDQDGGRDCAGGSG